MESRKKQFLENTEKQRNEQQHNSPLTPSGCVRTLIIGGSGSGKTTSFVYDILPDRKSSGYLIYCSNPNQPVLKDLKAYADSKNLYFEIITNWTINPTMIEELARENASKGISFEVIFDDVSDKSNFKTIVPLFTAGRHYNISPTLIVHKLKTNANLNEIKDSCNAFYSFGSGLSQATFCKFARDLLDITNTEMNKTHNKLMTRAKKNGFPFCLAVFPEEPHDYMRLRAGHRGIIWDRLSPAEKEAFGVDPIDGVIEIPTESETKSIDKNSKPLSNKEIDNHFGRRVCYMSNEDFVLDNFLVINTGNLKEETEGGVHWVLIYKLTDKLVFYFDSFGNEVDNELIGKLKDFEVVRNDLQIQEDTSALCGYYCISVAELLDKNVPYYHLYKYFSGPSEQKNNISFLNNTAHGIE